jgi:beta-N-acetylhexosaminidase
MEAVGDEHFEPEANAPLAGARRPWWRRTGTGSREQHSSNEDPVSHVTRSPFLLLILGLASVVPGAAQQRSTSADARAVERRLKAMSLPDRVAQLVMPWVGGGYTAYDDPTFERVLHWVDSLHVGGVVISIGSPVDIAARLNHLQRRARVPLLVASDLEGGTAFRFTGGTPFPTNMGVGATGRDDLARAMGRITAAEGRAVGVHVTFSPVADVNNNPSNPIINTRSFGEDPGLVARMVAAQVRGTREGGMLSTAKHFPGHGDTETDSHLALPIVAADWSRLSSVELVPFRAAIAAGVDLVMSAHVAMPGVDSGRIRPATMVPGILTGILRDSLGFRGLIVTDALDMGGIVGSYGAGEAAVQALLAGSDILLMPSDPVLAVQAVVEAVRAGRVKEARLNQSVRRILTVKQQLGLHRRRTVNIDSVPDVVGRDAHLETAREASARSLVLLRDSGVLDSLSQGKRRLALVTYGEGNASGVGTTLAAELRRAGHELTTFRLSPASGPASYDSAAALAAAREFALFAVAVRVRESAGTVAMPASLADLVSAAGPRGALLSFGSPYLISQVPTIGTYLVAWVANPLTERAAADALRGSPISGRLPVAIPPGWQVGAGIERRGGGR